VNHAGRILLAMDCTPADAQLRRVRPLKSVARSTPEGALPYAYTVYTMAECLSSTGDLLVVVYTFRDGEPRLISARRATRRERKTYEG
jgi:hypothetical protein